MSLGRAGAGGAGAVFESGEVDVDILLSEHFRLDEINEAMARLQAGDVVKPIIDIGEAA